MHRNLLHYQRALFLRKKKGYSYREIREEIPVAKSTLSGWLNEIELTKRQVRRINKVGRERLLAHNHKHNLGEWNRAKRQREITEIRVAAKREIKRLNDQELFIAGIMLYWAEGNKVGATVGVSNSDPAFIAFIMYWFRKCIGVDEKDFRASVHYHEGQSEEEMKRFWSAITGIPLDQFRKGFCKPPGTGHRKHYLQHGTLQVRVCKSADLLHKILAWKDGLIQEIVSGRNRGRP